MEDAKDLFLNYTSDIEASEFLQREPHKSVEQTENFIREWGHENWLSQNGRYAWSLTTCDAGKVVGIFLIVVKENRLELHFGLAREKWGKGYATEAGLLIMAWLNKQSEFSGEVFTICDVENLASLKVLSKLGFRKKKILNEYIFLPAKGDKKRDCLLLVWQK